MPSYNFTLGTWVNNAAVGTFSSHLWTNPGNAQLIDGAYAVYISAIAGQTQSIYLEGTGPNSIPSWAANEVLTSITVNIDRFSNGPSENLNTDALLYLVVGGTILTAINRADTSTVYPTTLTSAAHTFTSSDLSTLGVTKSSITSSFGIALSCYLGGQAANGISIDQIAGSFNTSFVNAVPPAVSYIPSIGMRSL